MRRPRAVIVAAWAVVTAAWLAPGVTVPDGLGHVAWAASALADGDLLFYDEWATFGLVRDGRAAFKEVTPTRHLGNHWAAGCSAWWLPPMLAADVVARAAPPLHEYPRDGLRLPWNVAVVASSALAALLALLAGFEVARRIAGERAAAFACVGAWLGTSLAFYALRGSTMGHAVTSFACAAVVLLAVRLRESLVPERALALGLAAGFAFAARPQVAPIAMVVAFVVPLAQWPAALRLAPWGAGGWLLGASPQLVGSAFVYGSPLGFARSVAPGAPWAAFERTWTWELFLSWYHGLLTWTPWAGVGLLGLVLAARAGDDLARRLGWAGLAHLAVQAALNGTMDRPFWGGHAFGQRRFDSLLPFLVIGAAIAWTRWPRAAAAALVACCAWTCGLLLAADRELDLNAYVTGGELAAAWLAGWAHALERSTPLGSIPAGAIGDVLIVLAAVAALAAAVAVAALRIPDRARVAAACVAFAAIAAWLGTCGARGSRPERLAPWGELIARTEALGDLEGALETRLGLLEHELAYLRRSGREALAARTERDLAEFRARVEARLARAPR